MQINLQIFENGDATSCAVAELIKEKVKATPDSEFLNIAVSGGTTPRMLFELLGNEYETSINWKKVRLFWVDERCVEPTDSESNFGMTYDAFLQKTIVPGENIFRMRGEEIPEYEAERYRDLLRKELPARGGYPVFDLVLLGMGNDGHTASIFPNDLSLIDSELSVAVNLNPYTQQKRITLTGNTINNAIHIVFIISGESKSMILKEIIQNKSGATNYPAAHIGNSKGKVDFYIDKSAASKL
jgi:6-phosphogluconolactonase